MNTTDVRGTLRDMWDTRPARPRDDRQIAGVAAGIARRYDIDPVLVRVGLAVAALLFLLHRSRADRGPAAVAPPSWPLPTEGVSLVKGVSKEDAQQPPSWDPLGAAPFAWDLPEPAPAAPAPPPKRRAPVTL